MNRKAVRGSVACPISISKATLAENLGILEGDQRPLGALDQARAVWKKANGFGSMPRRSCEHHYPLDSELLYDGIRVVTHPAEGIVDHQRRVLSATAARAPGQLPRSDQMASKTAHYAEQALAASASGAIPSVSRNWLGRCTKSSSRLNDGSFRARPSRPCSLFEEHTDIIKKSPRETAATRCLSHGASSLILDCVVERGNPADKYNPS